MKIALFGASGTIGQRIAEEALGRGHAVTAIARNPARIPLHHERLTAVQGDVRSPDSVAKVAAGHDAVVNATGPAEGEPGSVLVEAARALIEGMPRAGVRRLIVVGGAGSLEVAPGVQLVDTPDFPPAWRPAARAARDALAVYRSAPPELDWTYLSPAAFIEPGERTGAYRTGTDQLVTNAAGESRISAEDFAVAVVDELESPRFSRRRFTVAY